MELIEGIKIFSTKTVLDNFDCLKCDRGILRKTGKVFMTEIEQHEFKCDLCKHVIKIKFN